MTNDNKAKELADYQEFGNWGTLDSKAYQAAMSMAEWKDAKLDEAMDKALQRNTDFLHEGKITQYGYDVAFATIQNVREFLKQSV